MRLNGSAALAYFKDGSSPRARTSPSTSQRDPSPQRLYFNAGVSINLATAGREETLRQRSSIPGVHHSRRLIIAPPRLLAADDDIDGDQLLIDVHFACLREKLAPGREKALPNAAAPAHFDELRLVVEHQQDLLTHLQLRLVENADAAPRQVAGDHFRI